MHKDSFDFVYNAEDDYYDWIVDKKIQKVVEELKALPHDVLIRYLTYWSEAIDSRKYVVERDLSHEEWYTDVVTMQPVRQGKNDICMPSVILFFLSSGKMKNNKNEFNI